MFGSNEKTRRKISPKRLFAKQITSALTHASARHVLSNNRDQKRLRRPLPQGISSKPRLNRQGQVLTRIATIKADARHPGRYSAIGPQKMVRNTWDLFRAKILIMDSIIITQIPGFHHLSILWAALTNGYPREQHIISGLPPRALGCTRILTKDHISDPHMEWAKDAQGLPTIQSNLNKTPANSRTCSEKP